VQRKIRLLVFLCLACIVLIAWPREHLLQYLYPLRYQSIIVNEAQAHDIDPLLIAAVIRVESRFNPNAVSPKGAVGLMQVMPSTGAWVAEQLKMPNWLEERLSEPEINIKIGTWYLAYLINMFDGSVNAALAAYNGGQTHVKRWLESGTWDGTDRQSHRIPFPETRLYLGRVLRAYVWYQRAYPALNSR
jgi:soluble lytic murein transglycosylase